MTALSNYLNHGILHPQHADLKKVEHLKKYGNKCEATELALRVVQYFVEQAKGENAPEQRALLYANAHSILRHEDILDSVSNPKEALEVIIGEAVACQEAAENTASPLEKAQWHTRVATSLMHYPEIHPIQSPTKTARRYELASTSWEALGDLFVKYKKTINVDLFFLEARLHNHTYSFSSSLTVRPKFTAALCFANALYASENVNFIKHDFKDLSRSMALAYKTIQTMESVGLRINDFVFNAHYHELLATFLEFKAHLIRHQSRFKDAKDPELQTKIFEARKESAKCWGKLLPEGNAYYHHAINLRGAALSAPTEGKKIKLMQLAAKSAEEFRKSRHLSIEISYYSEMEVERDAFQIIADHYHLEERKAF